MTSKVLAEAWRLLRPHLVGLASLYVAVLLPLEVALAAVDDARGADSWESFTLLGVITVAMGLSIALGVLRVTASSWRAAAAETARRAGPLVGVTLVACAGILAGAVLLVVPGVVLATWWILAYQAVVLENRGVRSSLGRSRALVRGGFWTALAVLAVEVGSYVLPLALALASERTSVDVAAATAADVLSTLVFVAATTALYRVLLERE